MNKKIGDLKLLDVRTLWQDEAINFTPWLAREENIGRLGDALGIELEVENTEVAVGPYQADIVALDTSTGDYVVIENQLERTNHDHLGKAITYASVLDASAVVWIARDFSEEHKKALDWLNDKSTEDVAFFGVRVELWQIDDSLPAVQFNVISRPADIVRSTAVTKASRPLTEVKKLQGEFWSAFRDGLMERKIVPSARKARPQYWYNVALGRTGIHLSNVANTNENRIGVRVYLRHKYNSEAALAQLVAQKEEIESEIGEALLWNPNEKARDKIIAIYREADLNRRGKWPEYLDWMLDVTARFRKTFMPRVKRLDLEVSETQQEPPDEIDTENGT
jgi:hypothetical protein